MNEHYQKRITIGLALCLGTGVMPAHAQFAVPAPIEPPKVVLPAPIQPGAGGGSLLPVGPGTAAKASLPPATLPGAGQGQVSVAAVRAPAIMAQLVAGDLTPEKAWETGALTVDDLVYILDRYVSEWGFINGTEQVDLRRELVTLLVGHCGGMLSKPAALAPMVRLWLADYFMSTGDVRTVALSESILGDAKGRDGKEDPLVFQTIERLGRYYADQGELDRGEQTWLRMNDYYGPQSRFIPDSIVEAAQLDLRAGNVGKAHELYGKASQYGDGWATGMALFDQARQLMGHGDLKEAQQLLAHPVTGQGAAQANIAVLSLLGWSHYLAGDFDLARRVCQNAIDEYKMLPQEQQGRGLQAPVAMAQRTLHSVAQWSKSPIVCEPPELHVAIKPAHTAPVIRRLYVRTFREVPLRLSVDSTLVKARIADDAWGDEGVQTIGRNITKEVIVEIAPEAVRESLTATLVVSGPWLDHFSLSVPIHVDFG